jgi:hypothetical protein
MTGARLDVPIKQSLQVIRPDPRAGRPTRAPKGQTNGRFLPGWDQPM